MDYLSVAMTRDYVELLEIIRVLPKEEREKIPKDEIEFYEKKKDRNYHFKIDPNIELSKQNISRGAYALFVILYQNYIATPEENKLINDILELNEQKREIRDNKKITEIVITKEESVALIKQEKSFFKRFLNRIRKFFGFKEVN